MEVAIADDSGLFREGLALLLRSAGVRVPLEAATGDDLLNLLPVHPVDAVVLDVRMPPTFTEEGLNTAIRVRKQFPGVGILLLSTYAETAYAAQLLGACESSVGYLLKDRVSDSETLLDALHRVVGGEIVVDSSIVQRLLAKQRHRDPLEGLTEREESVLRLMAEGRSNAGIARELYVGTKTVERHIASILQRLGIQGTVNDNRRVLAVLSWLRAAGQS